MSHFNKEAANWDEPKMVQMMATLAGNTIPVLKEEGGLAGPVALIDFGCGTGLFGLEFADYAKSMIGIDTSEGMLEVFNRKVAGDDRFRSILVDLEHEELPGGQEVKADLIVSSMSFHHLKEPAAMVGRLKNMLNPGGMMALVDLDQEDGSFHPDNEGMGVVHFGFSKQTVETWAGEHGLSCRHTIVHSIDKNDRTYPIFLAILK